MKRLLVAMGMVMIGLTAPVQPAQAQIPIVDIIKGAVKKVIKAADLAIQRQQNKVIWLQNAQKTLENTMSKLKLQEISEWTEKQRTLYKDYYEELRKVKSAISYYQRIRDIARTQVNIVEEYKRSWSLVRRDKNFNPEELDYISRVYTGMLDESVKNLDQLFIVVNSFQTQMSDAKRMELIREAADKMDNNYQDLKAFGRQHTMLSLQRAKTQQEVETVKSLYGLK